LAKPGAWSCNAPVSAVTESTPLLAAPPALSPKTSGCWCFRRLRALFLPTGDAADARLLGHLSALLTGCRLVTGIALITATLLSIFLCAAAADFSHNRVQEILFSEEREQLVSEIRLLAREMLLGVPAMPQWCTYDSDTGVATYWPIDANSVSRTLEAVIADKLARLEFVDAALRLGSPTLQLPGSDDRAYQPLLDLQYSSTACFSAGAAAASVYGPVVTPDACHAYPAHLTLFPQVDVSDIPPDLVPLLRQWVLAVSTLLSFAPAPAPAAGSVCSVIPTLNSQAFAIVWDSGEFDLLPGLRAATALYEEELHTALAQMQHVTHSLLAIAILAFAAYVPLLVASVSVSAAAAATAIALQRLVPNASIWPGSAFVTAVSEAIESDESLADTVARIPQLRLWAGISPSHFPQSLPSTCPSTPRLSRPALLYRPDLDPVELLIGIDSAGTVLTVEVQAPTRGPLLSQGDLETQLLGRSVAEIGLLVDGVLSSHPSFLSLLEGWSTTGTSLPARCSLPGLPLSNAVMTVLAATDMAQDGETPIAALEWGLRLVVAV
jgi:hypothetical protein